MPDFYRAGEEKEMLKELLRPADAHIESNLKMGMLKRKYILLLDVIQSEEGYYLHQGWSVYPEDQDLIRSYR